MFGQKRTIVGIRSNLVWKSYPDPNGNGWVAACDALRLVAEGDTQAELMAAIADSINAFLHDLWQDGELERFLSEHSWQLTTELPKNDGNVWFDVPIELIAQDASRHGPKRMLS